MCLRVYLCVLVCFGVFWCVLVRFCGFFLFKYFGVFFWCSVDFLTTAGSEPGPAHGASGRAARAPWGRAERRASRGSGAAGAAAPGHRDGQRRLCRRWIVEVGGTPGRGHGPGAARGRLTDAARGSARGRLGWASERGQRDGRSGPSAGLGPRRTGRAARRDWDCLGGFQHQFEKK